MEFVYHTTMKDQAHNVDARRKLIVLLNKYSTITNNSSCAVSSTIEAIRLAELSNVNNNSFCVDLESHFEIEILACSL